MTGADSPGDGRRHCCVTSGNTSNGRGASGNSNSGVGAVGYAAATQFLRQSVLSTCHDQVPEAQTLNRVSTVVKLGLKGVAWVAQQDLERGEADAPPRTIQTWQGGP